MLRRIPVSEGSVNGAIGVIKKFKLPELCFDQLETGELPDAVYIRFGEKGYNAEGEII